MIPINNQIIIFNMIKPISINFKQGNIKVTNKEIMIKEIIIMIKYLKRIKEEVDIEIMVISLIIEIVIKVIINDHLDTKTIGLGLIAEKETSPTNPKETKVHF